MLDSKPREFLDDVAESLNEDIRDRSAPRSAGGKVVFLALFLMVLAALAMLATSASHWKKEVVVRSLVVDGELLLPESELLARMADCKGANLQELDADALKGRFLALPYIKDAVVSKELNGTVRVKIVEREPVALGLIGRTTMIMDREGFLLPWRQDVADRYPDLFVISGFSRLKAAEHGLQQLDQQDVDLIVQFLEALSEVKYASLLLRQLHLAPNNMSWCLSSQSPTRFIVGNDGNFKEKLKKFEIFCQKVVSKKGFGFYDTVDLRFRERVFTTSFLAPKPQQTLPQ
jgi:cell division protein FtsQ